MLTGQYVQCYNMSGPSARSDSMEIDMLTDAYQIVRNVTPHKSPEASCMLVAATVAGMRGLTLRHVKVGALFWPDYFEKIGDFQLSIMGGWGLWGFSSTDGSVCLQDDGIHDDGGFCGHAWVETDDGNVIDLMHEVDGGPAVIYGDKWQVVARWYRRPALERRIKSYWRMEMQACAREGRKWAKKAGLR